MVMVCKTSVPFVELNFDAKLWLGLTSRFCCSALMAVIHLGPASKCTFFSGEILAYVYKSQFIEKSKTVTPIFYQNQGIYLLWAIYSSMRPYHWITPAYSCMGVNLANFGYFFASFWGLAGIGGAFPWCPSASWDMKIEAYLNFYHYWDPLGILKMYTCHSIWMMIIA